MSKVSMDDVKKLRAATQAGFSDCKKALEESDGDFEKAVEFLRKKGIAKAAKKVGLETGEGVVESYIHAGGTVGVLVHVGCQTDFVARTDNFKDFAREVAIHIAAANPSYVSESDVPAEVVEKERQIATEQMKDSGKPAEIIEKIVEGKIKKYYEENCLIYQKYFRDDSKTIQDLMKESIAKLGENVVIVKFARFQVK